MPKKTIIFDFDGTIVDSFEIVFEIANQLAGKLGYSRITKVEIEKLRGCTVQEQMKKFGVSYLKLISILKEARIIFGEKIEKIKPIKGLVDVLEELKKEGFVLGIITSNSIENTENFLNKNRIDLFDFVFSAKSFFGKHRKIKKVITSRKIVKSEVVYVGDEVRDIEAAKKAGIKVIAVSWGLNSKDILKKHKPDVFINSPVELKRAIEKLI